MKWTMTACTKCGSQNIKLALDHIPTRWDRRKWYRCLGCGQDFVVPETLEDATIHWAHWPG